jgi:DNA-binding NarL/FixJ family response regulator
MQTYSNLTSTPAKMPSKKTINIAIADDHKIFRDGIKLALAQQKDLKIIWEAEDGREMMDKIAYRKPDILLMDISMPVLNGVNALLLIKKQFESVKIIVLSMYDDQQMISRMIENGANAYLTKTTEPAIIYEAIKTCYTEDFYFSDLVNKLIVNNLLNKKNAKLREDSSLNPIHFNENEIKILQLLSEDMVTEEISKTIFLSPRTVENIRQHMKVKVNAKTIGGLIMYGLRNKIIE